MIASHHNQPRTGPLKWIALLLLAAMLIFSVLYFFFYPSTTITRGVLSTALDNKGTPAGHLASSIEEMKARGVTLKYKAQSDKASAKPILEFLITDSEVDWAIVPNTGAQLPEEITKEFVSLGVVQYAPFGFFVKSGNERLKRIGDLKGKKIVIWSSPEGNDKPAFSKGGAKASVYSNDYIIEQLFLAAGVTAENSTIINAWPEPMLSVPDWDVIITRLPGKETGAKYRGFSEKLSNSEIVFAELTDLEAVAHKIPAFKLIKFPASGFDLRNGIPKTDVTMLAFTLSAVVKSHLEHGLVLTIAEYLKDTYGKASEVANKGEFPNFSSNESFPPSKVAKDYYDHGMPLTRNYLSPGMYAFVVKLLLILVPLLTVAWPLTHFVPSIYHFYVKHKITHHYDELKSIEDHIAVADITAKEAFVARVDAIDQDLKNLRFPFLHSHFVQEVYLAREHVDLTKRRILES